MPRVRPVIMNRASKILSIVALLAGFYLLSYGAYAITTERYELMNRPWQAITLCVLFAYIVVEVLLKARHR